MPPTTSEACRTRVHAAAEQHGAWTGSVLDSLPVPQQQPSSSQMPAPPRPAAEHAPRTQEPKHKYSDTEWNRHRDTTYRLYIKEKRTLKETMGVLAKDHDFHPS